MFVKLNFDWGMCVDFNQTILGILQGEDREYKPCYVALIFRTNSRYCHYV